MAHLLATIFAIMAPASVGVITYTLLRLRWRKRERDDIAKFIRLKPFELLGNRYEDAEPSRTSASWVTRALG